MSRFTAPLVVSPLPDGRTWVIAQDGFGYDVGTEGSTDTVEVPKGMCTDFASVPRPIWWFVAPWGKHGHAAVVHDYGYWRQDRSRRAYDQIFLEAMTVRGTSPLRRRLMYLAVRWFGGFAWRANARHNAVDPDWKLDETPLLEALAAR